LRNPPYIRIMKTRVISMLFCIALSFTGFAQHKNKSNERLEAMRAQFLTEQLDLQPEEAQKFWPVYNKYREELGQIQKSRIKDLAGHKKDDDAIENMSEPEAEKLITEELERQRKILGLREAYYRKFREIIPVRKIALLYKAEIEFKKKLIHRLSDCDKKAH